jgi:hypothetical protein
MKILVHSVYVFISNSYVWVIIAILCSTQKCRLYGSSIIAACKPNRSKAKKVPEVHTFRCVI